MRDANMTITTDDGLTLDRTVLEHALKPLAQWFIPKNRLHIREKALGRGGYGVVKLAEMVSDAKSTGGSVTVAVKVLQTDDSSALPLRVAYRLTREMIAWSACNHENILPFVGYFLSRDLETAYLVSPFIRNGNVKDYLTSKEAKPEERLELIRDTLKGLHYLHTRDPPIIHGDLKSMMTGNPPYHDIRTDASVILVVCSDDSKRKTPEPSPTPTFPNGLLELLRKCWDFEPDNRPDVRTCMAALSPVPQTGTVRIWEEARWLDNWIMEYIPMFENTIQGCISQAALDPDLAQRLCGLSSFSRMELEEELQDLKTMLQKDKNGQRLPQLTKKYIKLREETITKEIETRRQQLVVTATGFIRTRSASTPMRRPRDPVTQILRAISTLRKPVRMSREQIGETLRELHTLLKDEVTPLDKSRYLSSVLPGFERLVRHYPDDFHPDVARFLIDVYYEYHVRRGNHILCLEVALQAAERYRELSRTNGTYLARRAGALEKVVASYEILGLYENARACLAEAIWVYQQLNSTTGNHQAFQIPLARTLVRYHQVLCRLGRDWNDSDVVDALREAIKIYDSRVWWGDSSQGSGLEQFGGDLADALVDLDLTLLRKGDRVEALKAEDQLMHLYKTLGEEEQAAEVKKRRDALLTMSSTARPANVLEGVDGDVV
ncbi:hypothetical protein FRC01_004766 [Tulasnella sp. 417]|nr:hypothetical protein FRC01_004766 [Tulasnella sp. 417]